MEPGFWHERWQARQTGFHQDSVNPMLMRHWPALSPAAGGRVLVPLCGKSLDMLWLRDQGHAVTGIEISPLAVEAFFAEQGIPATIHTCATGQCWRGQDIEIYCADFFTLDASQLGHFHACYDRAALVALPQPMRTRYAEQLRKLVPAVPGLMITLDYLQTEMEGPPFAVSAEELRQLFGSNSRLRQLEAIDILAENPAFRERGLSRLRESAWYLEYC